MKYGMHILVEFNYFFLFNLPLLLLDKHLRTLGSFFTTLHKIIVQSLFLENAPGTCYTNEGFYTKKECF